jgi:hypothetical protein
MDTKYETITIEAAIAAGLRPLSGPYLRSERAMMDTVIADMQRGGIRHAIVVEDPSQSNRWNYSVWRGPNLNLQDDPEDEKQETAE